MPIDPLSRWRELGEKPDFAGLPTFGGRPYTEDPADLADADVAILGAPMDDLSQTAPELDSDRARSAARVVLRAHTSGPGLIRSSN
jgi:hypothetical protein